MSVLRPLHRCTSSRLTYCVAICLLFGNWVILSICLLEVDKVGSNRMENDQRDARRERRGTSVVAVVALSKVQIVFLKIM